MSPCDRRWSHPPSLSERLHMSPSTSLIVFAGIAVVIAVLVIALRYRRAKRRAEDARLRRQVQQRLGTPQTFAAQRGSSAPPTSAKAGTASSRKSDNLNQAMLVGFLANNDTDDRNQPPTHHTGHGPHETSHHAHHPDHTSGWGGHHHADGGGHTMSGDTGGGASGGD